MKKLVSLVVAMFLLTSVLAGCGSTPAPAAAPAADTKAQAAAAADTKAQAAPAAAKKKIGVVVKALDSEHWLTVKSGAEKAAGEEGVDITVLAPDKESNVEQQFKIIEDLIQQKVDALAIAPCDSTGVKPFIETANKAKIPVFTIDTNADADIVSFAGTDNKMGGKMAGERIVKILNGKGKVALITGVAGQQTHRDRNAGFKEALAAAPGIKLVAEQPANSESALAMSVMENILQSNPDLDAVFCTSALMADGALEAIDAKGKAGKIKLVGFDTEQAALKSLKAGKIDAMVAQNPYNMGYLTIKNVVKYLKGEQVTKVQDTGTDLITIENLDKYLK